ncbi:hypothetical protein ITP53_26250 [Nonomuraea sp. K274]|uniref:Uncharacterized protein n=1 Tax=Nonomuraea cypriaca TaxID=1187855 RepID=A0A931F097_9ACTN|nr:hypothetical protein [Nonomuraea cypriaca]MBF8189170.1 hypothetical protein [Nonomuraea cypriaca]
MKLRVEDLEAAVRHGGAAPRYAEPDLHAELLSEINDRTKHLQAEIGRLKTDLATVRIEMGEEFSAVNTEVAGVRRVVSGLPAAPPGEEAGLRSEIAQEFTCLRSEMTDLGIKLDRLLKKKSA